MTSWRQQSLVLDTDGGPAMTIWYPAAAGHFIDPRVRELILDNPDTIFIMVHRAGMASSTPCWLILKGTSAERVSSFETTEAVQAVQMAPDKLGTTACAWLQTDGDVIVYSRDNDGVLWRPWIPEGSD